MIDRELKLFHAILKEINESNSPVGASILSLKIDASQATIGRALQNLEYRGYLEKASNKGRVITEKGKEYLESTTEALRAQQKAAELVKVSGSADKKLLLDVLETRKILERETAYLAASKITENQLRELELVIDRQEEEKRKGLLGEKEDLEFHCKIASISRNKVIEQILTLILTQNNVYLEFSYIRQRKAVRSSNDHRKILNAFADKDSELAAKLMVNHLDALIKDVTKYYK